MNNDALLAAFGMDAVAAVHGYRLAVRDEAAERGIYLVSEPLSGVIAVSPGECLIVDPIDIRLAFVYTSGRRGLAGRTLTWDPEHGWAISHRTASGPPCFYAGPGASPLDLIPTPPQVLDWAVGELDGNGAHPQVSISTRTPRRSSGSSASAICAAASRPSKRSCRHRHEPVGRRKVSHSTRAVQAEAAGRDREARR